MPKLIDLTGHTFGRLRVVCRTTDGASRQPRWVCSCDCGNEVTVFGNSLRGGATRSCGCLQRDRVSTHGMTKSSEFTIWQMMRQRCNNPSHVSYPEYGGRGIRVCEAWNSSFATFYRDMGPRPSRRHTIDRTNNDGPYSPENCRWVTALQQGRNKRNNRLLTLKGETLTVGDWCRRLAIPKSTLLNRLAAGIHSAPWHAPAHCGLSD